MADDKMQKFQNHMLQQQQDNALDLVAAGAVVQRTTTDFVQAIQVQLPRDLRLIKQRTLDEASVFPEGLVYAWTAAGAIVRGPTVKLAMMIAREWGNCDAQSHTVGETSTHWLFLGEFIDIERGYRLRREYRKRKSELVKGKYSDERKETMAFEAGQSKCIRNVICNAMPNGLIQAIMEKAEEAMREGVKSEVGGIEKQIAKIKKAFGKYSVKIEQLEDKLGKPSEDWTDAEIVTLRSLFTGLEDGHTSVGKEFAPESPLAQIAADANEQPLPPDDED